MQTIAISFVIPVFNESENIKELYKEIIGVAKANNYSYEIIFVNDGSTDSSEPTLYELYSSDPERVSVINFDKNYGKALALKAGFEMARGDIFITMDSDLQDDPAEIPRFVDVINAGNDLVSGWKSNRKDSYIKNTTSKFYNSVTSVASGIYLHDHNCGFKAYKREVAKALPLYGQLHRYIPLLANASGFHKITEISVHHRKRNHGKSKYGISRFIYGITGLAHALWLCQKIESKKPLSIKTPEYTLKSVLV